ncbi:MAG: hypothetical protein UU25_C0011G0008 [Microgenomates group bacterium GW2011_GWB1_40_9]|nr:MAG: hypothetical protein UU25_C0011G0008 [Microgenomates group bacterium GW2011_GWB1_40_9]
MKLLQPITQGSKQYVFRTLPNFFAPHTNPSVKNIHLVTLLCHKDISMFLYTIESLFYFIKKSLPIAIINDGTLTQQDIFTLQKHFSVSIFSTSMIERKLSRIFSKYPAIEHFITAEFTPIIKWKIAFMLLERYPKYIFIDSDILFFSPPEEIIDWIERPKKYCLNMEYNQRLRTKKYNDDDNYLDLYHSYRELLKVTYFKNTNTLFNNGILCVPDPKLIRAERLNKIFSILDKTWFDTQFGTDEFTLSCALTKANSVSLPKDKYTIQLTSLRPEQLPAICKHYCWRAKLLFPLDAIRLAVRTRLFSQPLS